MDVTAIETVIPEIDNLQNTPLGEICNAPNIIHYADELLLWRRNENIPPQNEAGAVIIKNSKGGIDKDWRRGLSSGKIVLISSDPFRVGTLHSHPNHLPLSYPDVEAFLRDSKTSFEEVVTADGSIYCLVKRPQYPTSGQTAFERYKVRVPSVWERFKLEFKTLFWNRFDPNLPDMHHQFLASLFRESRVSLFIGRLGSDTLKRYV